MTERRCIEEPDKLDAIAEELDGTWLDMQGVEFNSEAHTLRIPFRPGTERQLARYLYQDRGPRDGPKFLLTIGLVKNYIIQDTERVRYYDFDCLRYDPATRCLEVCTGIPLVLRATVTGFSVCIEETGQSSGA